MVGERRGRTCWPRSGRMLIVVRVSQLFVLVIAALSVLTVAVPTLAQTTPDDCIALIGEGSALRTATAVREFTFNPTRRIGLDSWANWTRRSAKLTQSKVDGRHPSAVGLPCQGGRPSRARARLPLTTPRRCLIRPTRRSSACNNSLKPNTHLGHVGRDALRRGGHDLPAFPWCEQPDQRA